MGKIFHISILILDLNSLFFDISRIIPDMKKEKVIEPPRITKQVLTGAADAAELILRIDDIISGGSSARGGPDMGGGMPPGMPPGMMGM